MFGEIAKTMRGVKVIPIATIKRYRIVMGWFRICLILAWRGVSWSIVEKESEFMDDLDVVESIECRRIDSWLTMVFYYINKYPSN